MEKNRGYVLFEVDNSSSLSRSFHDYPILGVVTQSSLNPKKERPLSEPFYELTYGTIQVAAVRTEEPY